VANNSIGYTYRLDGNVKGVNTYREEKGGFYEPSVPGDIHEGDIVTSEPLGSAKVVLNGRSLVKLGPDTVFEFKKHSLNKNKSASTFELMYGNAMIAPDITERTNYKYEIVKSNVSVAAENSEVAMQYSVEDKVTTIACFDGRAQVTVLNPDTAEPSYSKEIVDGEYIQITKKNVVNGPQKISEANERKILNSFRPNDESTETWSFSRKKPFHLARFSAGFRYYSHEISSSILYSAQMGYIPLFHLYSGLYLEPYFGISFTSTNLGRLFYQTGARLEYHFIYNFYAGAGLGYSWLSNRPFVDGGRDINLNVGYTFNDKMFTVLDGVRFSYFNAKTNGIKNDALCLDLIFGFGNGAKIN